MTKASEKKKATLQHITEELHARNKNTDQVIQELQDHITHTQKTASQVRNSLTAFYSEFRDLLAATEKQTLEVIRTEESRVLADASSQIKELEIQKAGIIQTVQEVEELCATADPFILMQESKSAGINTEKQSIACVKESLDEQTMSLVVQRKLNGLIEVILALKVKQGFALSSEFHLTLNPDTANEFIMLSGDLKTATHVEE